MFRFGKIKVAKDDIYGTKRSTKCGMLMLIIY